MTLRRTKRGTVTGRFELAVKGRFLSHALAARWLGTAYRLKRRLHAQTASTMAATAAIGASTGTQRDLDAVRAGSVHASPNCRFAETEPRAALPALLFACCESAQLASGGARPGRVSSRGITSKGDRLGGWAVIRAPAAPPSRRFRPTAVGPPCRWKGLLLSPERTGGGPAPGLAAPNERTVRQRQRLRCAGRPHQPPRHLTAGPHIQSTASQRRRCARSHTRPDGPSVRPFHSGRRRAG